MNLLICEVLESDNKVATGYGEIGGLEATSCHPGCSVFLGGKAGGEVHAWGGW